VELVGESGGCSRVATLAGLRVKGTYSGDIRAATEQCTNARHVYKPPNPATSLSARPDTPLCIGHMEAADLGQ
jgi:hypothetical protein